MSELLTDDEIDTLLDEVDDNDGSLNILKPEDVELYDLTSGVHRLQGWIQDIKIVDERIQNNLSVSLLGLLHKRVEVKRNEIHIKQFGEFCESLSVPTSINVYSLEGMHGFATIMLDANFVFALVNAFFGGGARMTKIEGRDFTDTEQRVIKLILETIIDSIKKGWREISGVEFIPVETEMNPAHLSSYPESEVLMIRSFQVEFSGDGGAVQLLMPGSIVDPIFRESTSGNKQEQQAVKDILKSRALHYVADVTGEIKAEDLTLNEVFKLEVGDIIAVDSPEVVEVKVNGVAKFEAKMGEVNGKVGLKILPQSE